MIKSGLFKSHAYSTALTTSLVLLGSILLSGCSKPKIEVISNYDATAYEQTQLLKAQVDTFFVSLLDKPQAEREFSNFESQYQQLSTSLEKFSLNNKVRSKNSESTKISQSIIGLWKKYELGHKTKNAYNDGTVKLNRSRFGRLFDSAAKAELAKKRN